MKTVDIRDAKTRLSALIAAAVKGEPFAISESGKALVKVTALEAPKNAQVRRLGFLRGQWSVPDDFDSIGRSETEQMFGLSE